MNNLRKKLKNAYLSNSLIYFPRYCTGPTASTAPVARWQEKEDGSSRPARLTPRRRPLRAWCAELLHAVCSSPLALGRVQYFDMSLRFSDLCTSTKKCEHLQPRTQPQAHHMGRRVLGRIRAEKTGCQIRGRSTTDSWLRSQL